jgi:hypothetical protein
VESGKWEDISNLHVLLPAFASASLIENTEVSVVGLALDPLPRSRAAKGGSVFNLNMFLQKHGTTGIITRTALFKKTKR